MAETFTVTSLADSGPGSLRQAILDANASAGYDLVEFAIAGTIRVGRTALPAITEGLALIGQTAPGYAGSPVVRVDFQNTTGLVIAVGAEATRINGLSLVDAAGAGVTVAAPDAILTGNFIGVWGNGLTVEPNRGAGILVQATARGARIGSNDANSFVLSNLVSGNLGNGITIDGAADTAVVANQIGTDAGGRIPLGNRGHGIRLTNGAARNLIGGDATGGNDPTDGFFARPPQGNLISANRGCGVLLDAGATDNVLSGNFIGTTGSGNSPLGNWQDGVAIVNADGNRLIGTTPTQDPFIFYNVVSGNLRNGLRVTNSDSTIIYANFFGLGADNATCVPNGRSGVLVNGDSQTIDFGAEIPLGNVMSGNALHGIEVRDTASGFVSFNSFVGQVAFGGAAPNGLSGIRITSSNPRFDPADSSTWNRIRTCLVGGNLGNGVEFLGNARGAEITDTAVGTDDDIEAPLPNLGHGIVVGGNASQIAIGGFQPSIQQFDGGFSVHTGGNLGYGIVIQGSAHDVFVFNTRVGLGVGTTADTAYALPNAAGGIFVGPGTSRVTIGGVPDLENRFVRYANEIVGNRGNGLTVVSSRNLVLLGNTIRDNLAAGIVLSGATGAEIGSGAAPNTIARNGTWGLYATGNLGGTRVPFNAILGNRSSGVWLNSARGITLGGAPLPPAAVTVSRIGGNLISDNKAWGLLATGWCRGSTIGFNTIVGNTPGDVNTRAATGLVTAFV